MNIKINHTKQWNAKKVTENYAMEYNLVKLMFNNLQQQIDYN